MPLPAGDLLQVVLSGARVYVSQCRQSYPNSRPINAIKNRLDIIHTYSALNYHAVLIMMITSDSEYSSSRGIIIYHMAAACTVMMKQ